MCKCYYPNPEKYVGCAIDLVQFVPDIWWNRPDGGGDTCYNGGYPKQTTIFGAVVNDMLDSTEQTSTRADIFEQFSWIFSFDDVTRRLYSVKRTSNSTTNTSRFLSYQLTTLQSTTHIYQGGSNWASVPFVRIPTFTRVPNFEVTCNGTWAIDVHDGMIVLAREDAFVAYEVPPNNVSNTTTTSNLMYSHVDVFNDTRCTPDSRFDQVRPKPTELYGYYHANMEYFNDPLGRVGLMDIPNLQDGYVSMLTYLEPDAFFTDAKVNETCSPGVHEFRAQRGCDDRAQRHGYLRDA